MRSLRTSNRNYLLIILSMVSFLNYIDRQIFTILLESVKADLQVSDAAMGLLSGTTFAIFYASASIPVGRWADRGSRRSILAGAVAIWSALTTVCGLAQSYLHLAVARAGVAVAECAAIPISLSMVADVFPRERRATMFGIIMAAGSLGIGIGLYAAGWANEHFGWRAAFMIVGAPGILLAIVMFLTIAEPPRVDEPASALRSEGVAGLLANPLYRGVLLLAGFGSMIMYSTLGWAPTFMMRIHGMSTAQVGLLMGAATASGSIICHYMTGFISDRLAQRDIRWYPRIAVIGPLIAQPFFLVFLFASNPYVAIAAFGLQISFAGSWLLPSYTIASRVVSANSRALASAMIAASLSLIGLGLGPFAIGSANDALTPYFHEEAIRYSMVGLSCCSFLLALGFYLIIPMVKAFDDGDRDPDIETTTTMAVAEL